jgi:molybdenum cofactor biosynthesis protein A
MKLTDKFGRIHDYLRISVTDRCNLSCIYCNPSDTKHNDNQGKLLSYEEISRLVNVFVEKFEFNKIRLTGGEPFARKDIGVLIGMLSQIKDKRKFELSATTNGTLIKGKLREYKKSGLDRLNFSLDALDKASYLHLSGSDSLDKVLETIKEAHEAGFDKIKVNTVIIRSKNYKDINEFVRFSLMNGLNIRFIEYMPFSDNDYNKTEFVPYKEMLEQIRSRYRLIESPETTSRTTRDYIIDGTQTQVSFISSISEHFCGDCNRLRITSDGHLKLCLFSKADADLDIAGMLRDGRTDDELVEAVLTQLQGKNQVHDSFEELIKLRNNNMISIGG